MSVSDLPLRGPFSSSVRRVPVPSSPFGVGPGPFDCYPNNSLCRVNCFNTWREFELEPIQLPLNSSVVEAELRNILGFILILCGHQQDVHDYFLKWIDFYSRYFFISRQDGGSKYFILVAFLEKLLGVSKVIDLSNHHRDIWSEYNQSLKTVFLVHID